MFSYLYCFSKREKTFLIKLAMMSRTTSSRLEVVKFALVDNQASAEGKWECWLLSDFVALAVAVFIFSSPELAQGELLGYRDVRRTCGRPRRTRRPRRPSVNFLACVHSRGNSFDPKFMKLCQNVNHHNI